MSARKRYDKLVAQREKLEAKIQEAALKAFGGVQRCPWCRRSLSAPRFNDEDQRATLMTCDECGGSSLWAWELGFVYLGAYTPPPPAFPQKDDWMRSVMWNAYPPMPWNKPRSIANSGDAVSPAPSE